MPGWAILVLQGHCPAGFLTHTFRCVQSENQQLEKPADTMDRGNEQREFKTSKTGALESPGLILSNNPVH